LTILKIVYDTAFRVTSFTVTIKCGGGYRNQIPFIEHSPFVLLYRELHNLSSQY